MYAKHRCGSPVSGYAVYSIPNRIFSSNKSTNFSLFFHGLSLCSSRSKPPWSNSTWLASLEVVNMQLGLLSLVIHCVLFRAGTALSLPPDLSSAITQAASLLNKTNISILNNTQSNPESDKNHSIPSTPRPSRIASVLTLNETLLKYTQVRCSRPAYGTVSYQSCFDALDTLNVRPQRVYTFGQRDAGLFDFSLPFRLLSSIHSLIHFVFQSFLDE